MNNVFMHTAHIHILPRCRDTGYSWFSVCMWLFYYWSTTNVINVRDIFNCVQRSVLTAHSVRSVTHHKIQNYQYCNLEFEKNIPAWTVNEWVSGSMKKEKQQQQQNSTIFICARSYECIRLHELCSYCSYFPAPLRVIQSRIQCVLIHSID